MIGRGAQGAPWRIAQVRAALAGGRAMPSPRGRALAEVVRRHYEAMLAFYGEDLGLRVARKHLGWYMEGAGTPAPLRRAILTEAAPARVLGRLEEALAGSPACRAGPDGGRLAEAAA
jgi:tRNA-dihydrouridine synthase